MSCACPFFWWEESRNERNGLSFRLPRRERENQDSQYLSGQINLHGFIYLCRHESMVLLWNLSPNQAYVLLNKPAYDDSEPQSKPLSVENGKGNSMEHSKKLNPRKTGVRGPGTQKRNLESTWSSCRQQRRVYRTCLKTTSGHSQCPRVCLVSTEVRSWQESELCEGMLQFRLCALHS